MMFKPRCFLALLIALFSLYNRAAEAKESTSNLRAGASSISSSEEKRQEEDAETERMRRELFMISIECYTFEDCREKWIVALDQFGQSDSSEEDEGIDSVDRFGGSVETLVANDPNRPPGVKMGRAWVPSELDQPCPAHSDCFSSSECHDEGAALRVSPLLLQSNCSYMVPID